MASQAASKSSSGDRRDLNKTQARLEKQVARAEAEIAEHETKIKERDQILADLATRLMDRRLFKAIDLGADASARFWEDAGDIVRRFRRAVP